MFALKGKQMRTGKKQDVAELTFWWMGVILTWGIFEAAEKRLVEAVRLRA